MSPRVQALLELLEEAHFDPWESVSGVLDLSHPRAERLKSHILHTKQVYWHLIATQVQVPPPPCTLAEMLRYERVQVQQLQDHQLDLPVVYCERHMTVAALVRLSARHAVWHAGQMALTRLD